MLLALNRKRDAFARRQASDLGQHLCNVLYGAGLNREDDVPRSYSSLCCRAVLQNTRNNDAAACGCIKGLGQFNLQVIGLHANPATRYLAILHEALEDLLCGGYRNGKTNPHATPGSGVNRGVDAQ